MKKCQHRLSFPIFLFEYKKMGPMSKEMFVITCVFQRKSLQQFFVLFDFECTDFHGSRSTSMNRSLLMNIEGFSTSVNKGFIRTYFKENTEIQRNT